MDIATIIGILAGLALMVGAIATQPGSAFFVNIPSLMIVFGGTVGATLLNYPIKEVISVVRVITKVFLVQEATYNQTVERMVILAEKARRDGILAIEKELENITDDFMRSGIQYAVDGTEPDIIREIMETELSSLRDRHRLGQSIFITMGTYAPAFGMIGTLIGLIQMLQALDDPTKIGVGMATALVTTFYGAVAANMFFLPMAGKLQNRSQEEIRQKDLIVQGILAIQSGDNPRIVREKLLTFLPPQMRAELSGER